MTVKNFGINIFLKLLVNLRRRLGAWKVVISGWARVYSLLTSWGIFWFPLATPPGFEGALFEALKKSDITTISLRMGLFREVHSTYTTNTSIFATDNRYSTHVSVFLEGGKLEKSWEKPSWPTQKPKRVQSSKVNIFEAQYMKP